MQPARTALRWSLIALQPLSPSPATLPPCTCRRRPFSSSGTTRGARPSTSKATGRRTAPPLKPLDLELPGLPEFEAAGEQVSVLYSPREFYDQLLERIKRAEKRIFLASLYLGKEEHELVETLHAALSSKPSLHVTLLFDALRSTRETPRPSSAALAASLKAAFPDRVSLSLFHTPSLAGIWKRIVPRRFDEGWGTQHMKLYGVDDAVLLSGANLSSDYFSNRQDRYFLFQDSPAMTQYFSELVRLTASLSLDVTAKDTTTRYPLFDAKWPEARSRRNWDWVAEAEGSYNDLTASWASRPASQRSSRRAAGAKHDTRITPVLQLGPFRITQETDLAVPAVFRLADELASRPGGRDTTLDWTSGYFSVREQYKKMAMQSRADVRIISAHPEANGFYNSRGVSKYIPPAYTYLERQFYTALTAASSSSRPPSVDMKEWRREGWTYHAKGLWLTPSYFAPLRVPASRHPLNDPNDRDLGYRSVPPAAPALTIVGSSNFGTRSAERDLEATVLLQTTDPGLRKKMRDEVKNLRKHATVQVDEKLFNRKERKVPWGVTVAADAIKTML